MKSLLQQVDYFFVLNKDSKEQLKNIHINQVEIIGDTRIDRVLNTAKNLNIHPQLDHFIDKNRCFIAGSTWPEDHQLFSSLPQLCQQTKWIIAPHKVDPSSIKKIENELTVPYTKWSTYEKSKDQNKRVLLLDCIGVLASAYSYANAAYVGGAMGKTGLHNILEATAFGIPVIIGRNYKRYPEANDLIKLGGVKSVTSAQEFELFYNTLKEKPLLKQQMGEINKTYLESNKGATSKIIYFLKTHYNK
jgi:3-deoxy-D-manno-octulosonic-acid transferase